MSERFAVHSFTFVNRGYVIVRLARTRNRRQRIGIHILEATVRSDGEFIIRRGVNRWSKVDVRALLSTTVPSYIEYD